MSSFTPDVELYGRDVYAPFGHLIGKLDRIVSPHDFIISGERWTCDSTSDFYEDRGKLFLDGWRKLAD